MSPVSNELKRDIKVMVFCVGKRKLAIHREMVYEKAERSHMETEI